MPTGNHPRFLSASAIAKAFAAGLASVHGKRQAPGGSGSGLKDNRHQVQIPAWLSADIVRLTLQQCGALGDGTKTMAVATLGVMLFSSLGGKKPDYSSIGVDGFGALLKQLARLRLLKVHRDTSGQTFIGPGEFAPLVRKLSRVTCYK